MANEMSDHLSYLNSVQEGNDRIYEIDGREEFIVKPKT